ncbi:MAG: WGR domain-containing protein [Gammaproteobacteria bacterium]|nr:WGR domain-containing protein [Gammaproteobacteria bacterium]
MRVYMQIPALDDKPARYYQLLLLEDLLEGWTLVREWGQQGRSGSVKRDHFATRELAESALLRVRDTQLKRGFKVVFMQGQTQPV